MAFRLSACGRRAKRANSQPRQQLLILQSLKVNLMDRLFWVSPPHFFLFLSIFLLSSYRASQCSGDVNLYRAYIRCYNNDTTLDGATKASRRFHEMWGPSSGNPVTINQERMFFFNNYDYVKPMWIIVDKSEYPLSWNDVEKFHVEEYE